MGRCKKKTLDKKICQRGADIRSKYCWQHRTSSIIRNRTRSITKKETKKVTPTKKAVKKSKATTKTKEKKPVKK